MSRCRTFRYPRRTHFRALEIFHRADCNRLPRDIADDLLVEGHGEVSEHAILRWLREDPASHAIKAIALCQRLRRKGAAAHGDKDAYRRFIAAANEIGDVLTIAYERALKALPNTEIETAEDFALAAETCKHLLLAGLESQRLIAEIRASSFASPRGHA